jgi:hypothetical protein
MANSRAQMPARGVVARADPSARGNPGALFWYSGFVWPLVFGFLQGGPRQALGAVIYYDEAE